MRKWARLTLEEERENLAKSNLETIKVMVEGMHKLREERDRLLTHWRETTAQEQRTQWLEESLKAAGLFPVSPVLKFPEAARLDDMYRHVEALDGWRDYTARLKVMRDELVDELMRGTVDKFGKTRDDEKRAVLVYLDRMLIFPRLIHEQYDTLRKRQLEMEEKARNGGNIHMDDVFPGGSI